MDCPARSEQVSNAAVRKRLGFDPAHAVRCYLHGSLGWMIDRADGELEFFRRKMVSNQNGGDNAN